MKTMPRKMLQTLTVLGLVAVLAGCSFLNWFDVGDAVAATTSNLTYPIVDTNQTETYNNTQEISPPAEGQAFYGQDAQIDGNQPRYVDNGDGTVTDLVTGLMWQQGYSGKMTYEEAVASVDDFELAGYTDWRLPTIKELFSLIDFAGVDIDPQAGSASHPFIDTSVFEFAYGDTSIERIIDSQWVTTTLYTGSSGLAGGGSLMFGVNFADGRIKGYPVGTTLGPGGQEKTYYVRYVRGNTRYGVNDFIDNGNGTITDLATGLMWSQDDSVTTMNWEEALAYVQQLNDETYLGYSDWYLPNAKELQSIVDYNRSPDATDSAAIDPLFHCTQITNEAGQKDWGFYWTGTTHLSQRGAQDAVYIAFGRGLGYMNGQFDDVHGAGCQRSDPKTGMPSYGFGPQGDVRRVDNFVRVVRDVSGSVSLADVTTSAGTTNTGSGSFGSPDSDAIATTTPGDGAIDADSYVLFAPLAGEKAYLISRDGNVVHDWSLSGRPGNAVYLVDGGKLLATYTVSGSFDGGGAGGGVELLSWDGDPIWSYELATDKAQLHHDVEMLPNGNVLMIAWEAKTKEEALAAGLSASQIPASGEVWSEMILELDPALDQIVWEWHLWDHALPSGWDASEHPEKIDLSYAANSQTEDWFHINSVDYSEALDQIVLSVHNTSEIWIINHDLSTSQAAGSDGDLLYRFGNPAAYESSGSQVLVNQHDAEWLPNGDLLVFDNGNPRTRPYSRVVELDLPNYENGLHQDAGIVWSYGAASGNEYFFADHISGAQRLENGDTMICDGVHGRFFEVTSQGETVWEYVNPYSSTGPDGTHSDVFRCEQYSADSPELQGQNLGSASTMTAQTPVTSTPASHMPGQNLSGGAQPGGSAPNGIASVSPASLQASGDSQLVTIELAASLAPPQQIRFTSIQIGSIPASSWTRSGNTLQAWFALPASLTTGTYALTVSFPGRDNEAVHFSTPIEVN
jgi:hypothetical protein